MATFAGAVVAVNCGGGGGVQRTGAGGSSATTGAGGAGGGVTGSGGAATTGAGGSTISTLSCTPGVNPTRPLLTDFSDWDGSAGKWGMIGNLRGSKFPYVGTVAATTMTATIDTTAGNLVLAGAVQPGDYAGGGVSFDACVNTTTYHGVSFKLGGDVSGCDLSFNVQTWEQQAMTNGGGCDRAAGASCYSFPKATLTFTPDTTTTIMFADLTGGSPADRATIGTEIVGLQWQFQSPGNVPDGGTQAGCPAVSMTIDDITLVP